MTPAPLRKPREIPCIAALLAVVVAEAAAASGEGGTLFRTSLKETASARLAHALDQFAQPMSWIEIAVGIALAVLLSAAIAFHPRGVRRRGGVEPPDAVEERKALVLLGLIGAALSALVLVDQAMAFVILAVGVLVGGLFGFRAAAGNPHLAGRAVLVLAVGLACGLSQYLLALLVAVAVWIALWWLQARRSGEIKVRVPVGADLRAAELAASLELRILGCRVRSLRAGQSGRAFTMVLSIPASLDEVDMCRRLESRLGVEVGHTEVELKSAP